jgi:hypothetical protein
MLNWGEDKPGNVIWGDSRVMENTYEDDVEAFGKVITQNSTTSSKPILEKIAEASRQILRECF